MRTREKYQDRENWLKFGWMRSLNNTIHFLMDRKPNQMHLIHPNNWERKLRLKSIFNLNELNKQTDEINRIQLYQTKQSINRLKETNNINMWPMK